MKTGPARGRIGGMKMRRYRDLPEIKSVAGTGGAATRPKERHVLQFKIGCLELERSRRMKERAGAIDRIRLVDRRILEIDSEIRKHHDDLGYAGTPPGVLNAVDFDGHSTASGQPRRMIRYGG